MSDLRILARKIWVAVCLLLLVILLWQWWWLGNSQVDNKIVPATLQKFSSYDAAAATVDILAHNLWEPDRKLSQERETTDTVTEAAALIPSAANLHLLAIAVSEGKLLAYIGEKDKPDTYQKYTEGEQFPSGETIVKILEDRVIYASASKTEGDGDSDNTDTDNTESDSNKTLYLFGRTGSNNE